MNRKIERNLLRVSAVWNVLIGLITMFGYYPWFEDSGIQEFQQNNQYDYLGSSLISMISKLVLIIALVTILIGIISWLVAKNMRNNQINKKTIYWLIACVIIHIFFYDVIGIILYLTTSILYISKNKAVRLATSN